MKRSAPSRRLTLFSPDGQKIAYLRFDESRVPVFEMMRYDGKLYNEAYSFKYPKAGDANSVVDLYVYDLKTGETERVDVGPDRDSTSFNRNGRPTDGSVSSG